MFLRKNLNTSFELIHAFRENGKMSVEVFRDNKVFVNEEFATGRGLSSVFSHALVQVPKSIAYITCITQE